MSQAQRRINFKLASIAEKMGQLRAESIRHSIYGNIDAALAATNKAMDLELREYALRDQLQGAA